mmetsp:Transcript_17447/g.30757  ORF Transcript_17447/g.30757 Transcript_17447/m.30757 type:complete len:389 (-) Transcript_17447:888-2054(-)
MDDRAKLNFLEPRRIHYLAFADFVNSNQREHKKGLSNELEHVVASHFDQLDQCLVSISQQIKLPTVFPTRGVPKFFSEFVKHFSTQLVRLIILDGRECCCKCINSSSSQVSHARSIFKSGYQTYDHMLACGSKDRILRGNVCHCPCSCFPHQAYRLFRRHVPKDRGKDRIDLFCNGVHIIITQYGSQCKKGSLAFAPVSLLDVLLGIGESYREQRSPEATTHARQAMLRSVVQRVLRVIPIFIGLLGLAQQASVKYKVAERLLHFNNKSKALLFWSKGRNFMISSSVGIFHPKRLLVRHFVPKVKSLTCNTLIPVRVHDSSGSHLPDLFHMGPQKVVIHGQDGSETLKGLFLGVVGRRLSNVHDHLHDLSTLIVFLHIVTSKLDSIRK